MAERIASERVELNERHFKGWSVVFGQVFEKMQNGGLDGDKIRNLERVAAILDRAQKGQRLARGLSLDGKTEEQIRAEAAAESRSLVDAFLDIVKEEVPDEDVRDRIARALFERCPSEQLDAV
jgi:phage protein D